MWYIKKIINEMPGHAPFHAVMKREKQGHTYEMGAGGRAIFISHSYHVLVKILHHLCHDYPSKDEKKKKRGAIPKTPGCRGQMII